jgi:hypothetical protein
MLPEELDTLRGECLRAQSLVREDGAQKGLEILLGLVDEAAERSLAIRFEARC